MAGFMAHLRLNGFTVGPSETMDALTILTRIDANDASAARMGLKSLLAGRIEEWRRFDELFEAYWQRRGKTRPPLSRPHGGIQMGPSKPGIWTDHLPADPSRRSADATGAGDGGDTEREHNRLAASTDQSLAKTDLRHMVDPDEIAAAEKLAFQLASAMRYRLSRRARAAKSGARLDLRRTLRRAIPTGGEPIDLVHRKRPDHPVRIVALLDVSGSMKQYSRFFLQFVKGLVCTWMQADAYLFHTRLVRVTDAVREHDSVKAMTRLSLMMEGFGGGTRIGESLRSFNDHYAKQALNSRSVVMVLSDGYDTGAPELLAAQLGRLKRRARRIVWLNPLLGWSSYQPVAQAMAAARPHIDHFAAAHTLDSLAAIETDLASL
jgi:uncharacterized protein with von Willebrand factor type A (vWA) domain